MSRPVFTITFACLFFAGGLSGENYQGLPVAYAPFARSGSAVQPVELLTFEYRTGSAWCPSKETYRWAEFVSGEKSVLIAGKDDRISGLGENIGFRFGHLVFYSGKGERLAPGAEYLGEVLIRLNGESPRDGQVNRLNVDEVHKTVTCERAWSINGTNGVFSYTVSSSGRGKVFVDWNAGVDCATWCRFRLAEKIEALLQVPKDRAAPFEVGEGNWELCPSDPKRRISVSLIKEGPTGTVSIDFYESSALEMRPLPKTGGVDFWSTDAFDVPSKPGRNLMTNGGFEQGWKGWRTNRCAPLSAIDKCPGVRFSMIVSEAHSGRRALKIDLGGQRGEMPAFKSAPLALEPGRTYTISAWCRSDRKRGAGCAIVPSPEGSMVKQPWVRGEKPEMCFVVDEKWRRMSVPFVASTQGTNIGIWPWGGPIWIDDVSVVEGLCAATDVGADDFVEAHIASSDEYNYFYVGQHRRMRLELAGRPRLVGEIRVTVSNFYHEDVFSRRYRFMLDSNGLGEVALPDLDMAEIGKGVFVVRFDYVTGGLKWRDYARFTIVDPLDGKHQLAGFFAQFPWFAGGGSTTYFISGEYADLVARRMRELGIGATSWQSNATYAQGRWAPYFRKYGIVNKHHILQEDIRQRHPENFGWGKPGLACFTNAAPDELSFIEAEAYRSAKEAETNDVYWTYSNEEELWHPLVKTRQFDKYFKYQYACYKGLKRGFDERGMSFYYAPTHGTAAYRHSSSYAVMDGYLEAAARQNFQYTCIAVHTYHALDGSILGAADRDAGAEHLRNRLSHYGYPEATPILFPEGYNILPMYIPDWGAKDWGDVYHGAIPSQSLGLRESLHAGALARMYLMDLKYYPRLKVTHPWQSQPYIDNAFTPYMYMMVMNTIGHLLPDPRFVGGARPFPGVRAYCFRPTPTATSGVLAIWTSVNEVEKGLRAGDVLTMRLPPDVTFFDLMGNQRMPSESQCESQEIKIPLTTSPLFICAGDPQSLLSAVRGASGGMASDRRSYEMSFLSAKQCVSVPDWERISGSPLTNGVSGGVFASAKLSWRPGCLFLRVEVSGAEAPILNIEFDGLADARELPLEGPGPDDCAYSLKGATVCRTLETNTQFRDGGASGQALQDVEIEKSLVRKWSPRRNGGVWEIVFTPRFISPICCEKNSRFGLNLTVTSEVGSCMLAVDRQPTQWPIVELK